MRRLNVKFIVWLTGLGFVFAIGTLLIHRLQAGRIADAFLWQANKAEQERRIRDAVRFLECYLDFVPTDSEERARLATLLASNHMGLSVRELEEALFNIEQVLIKLPDRDDLRRLAVKITLRLRRFDLAAEHLDVLHRSHPEDGELAYLRGQLHEAQREYQTASDWYRKAVQHAPQNIGAYVHLADLLRERLQSPALAQRAAEADQIMSELVARNEGSITAHLARWRYRGQYGLLADPARLKEASTDVARALELSPEDADALLAGAARAELGGLPDEARVFLRKGLTTHPQDVRFYQALSRLQKDLHDPQGAAKVLRGGIATLPKQLQPPLVYDLACLYLDTQDWPRAESSVGQFRKLIPSGPRLDYLNGRLAVGTGHWAQAVTLLERARSLSENGPEFAAEIDALLGRCYQKLDDPARQIASWARLVDFNPQSIAARLELAKTEQSLGHIDEALDQYRQIMNLPGAPAGGWIEIANLQIQKTLQSEQPTWNAVEDALARAEKAQPKSVPAALLRAEMLVAQNQLEPAHELLVQMRDQKPKEVSVWTMLILLAERRAKWQEAQQFLDESKRQLGDLVPLRLARIQLMILRKDKDLPTALRELEAQTERYKPAEQTQLLNGLATAYYQIGDRKEAERLWTRLARLPGNEQVVEVRLLLLDLAIQSGNEAAAAAIASDIQRMEGHQGTTWHFAEASRLVLSARTGKLGALDLAQSHLDNVVAKRPTWPAAFLVGAEIQLLKGNPEQALAQYRQAMVLGDRSPGLARRLVELLYQCRHYEEADQEIRKLQKHSEGLHGLEELAVNISLQNDDPARAVEIARHAVGGASRDYRDFLWLGRVLAASGQRTPETEQNFRRAVELAPEIPETWIALVQFLAAANRQGKAEEVITVARGRLPKKMQQFAVAQCYELIGNQARAQSCYEAALGADPANIPMVENVAAFYLRIGARPEAERCFRRIVNGDLKASDAEVARARRNLAELLAADHVPSRFAEALTLVGLCFDAGGQIVDESNPARVASLEDRRAQVRVLSGDRRHAVRAKAIELLDDMKKHQSLSDEDRIILAQLYEADGSWSKARDQFSELSTSQTHNPRFLRFYADALLRHGEAEEAQQCVNRLEEWARKQSPEISRAFDFTELEVKILELTGENEKAYALLKTYAERKEAKPEDILLLVGFLGRHHRIPEAIDLCERAWKTCLPERVGGQCVAVIQTGEATSDQCARVEQWLKAAIQKQPGAAILFHLAQFYDVRERYDESEAVYRQILAANKDSVVALNNLAWLLAQRSSRGTEAMALIARALESAGARADLLDTRGIVNLRIGQIERAIEDFKQATQDTPSAVRYFHLARATQAAGDLDAAQDALSKAKAAGLVPDRLHPLERTAYQKLAGNLASR